MNPFKPVAIAFLSFLEAIGKLGIFAFISVSNCVRPSFYFRLLLRQMIDTGYYSLPVVGMKTLFAGMALGLQTYAGFSRFSAEDAIAKVVALGLTHDMASARKISDHIAMLYKGKIIWIGKTAEINSSEEPHVDQFIHGRAEGLLQMEMRRL